MTIGQYLQDKKKNKLKIPNFVESASFWFLSVEDKILELGTILKKKQSIALKILYRKISLRFDLRPTVKDPEVTKGRRLYCRFEDYHRSFERTWIQERCLPCCVSFANALRIMSALT